MKAQRIKIHLSLHTVAVLFVFTLLSLCINSGLYARYTLKDTAGDSAHVAAFSVKPGESYTTKYLQFADMAPGDTREYTFTVSSASEVAVSCSVSICTTGNLPLGFKINGKSVPADGTSVSFANFVPNQGEVTFTLTATWPPEENNISYLGEIDAVRLTIIAEQID